MIPLAAPTTIVSQEISLVLVGLCLTIDHNGRDTNGWEKSKETEEVVEMLAESRISGFDGLLCCYTHSKGDSNDSRGCEDDTSDQARSNVDVLVTHFADDAAKETGYLIE